MTEQSPDESGQAWQRYRGYLSLLARTLLDRCLDGKVDLSGVVQQTLLEAHQAQPTFAALDEPRRAAWLRRALRNNLIDEIRRGAAAGGPRREISLEAALDESSCRLEAWLAAEQSTPSQQALRNEQLRRLAAALEQLPADQRTAIELHELLGLRLAEVATELGRSKGAVAQLLFRGHKRLAELVRDGSA